MPSLVPRPPFAAVFFSTIAKKAARVRPGYEAIYTQYMYHCVGG